VQADTLVPDSPETSLSTLTVNFSNPAFLEEIGRENRWRARQGIVQEPMSLADSEKPRGLGIVQSFQEPSAWPRLNQTGAFSGVSPSPNLQARGPADPQNLNRYAYARNNALRYVDPSGYWTFSLGLGGAFFTGIGIRGGVTISIDDKGNIAILAGGGGGGYAAAGFNSLGPNIMITNAPTVDKLQGFSVQAGGQIGEVASVGAEWVIFSDGKQIYHGVNISGGATLQGPWPVELHGTFEHDWRVFGPVNLLDAFRQLWKEQRQ